MHTYTPEKRKSRHECVDIQPCPEACANIFHAIGYRVSELEISCRPSFVHVITTDADRIKARHVSRSVAEDVRDDAHRGLRWVDVRVAHHEFLENVVLDGSAQLVGRDPLLFGCNDVKGHDGNDGTVHRHRYTHLVEGNALKQALHVFYGVDSYTCFADIAYNSWVIRVVSAMRR